MSQLGAVQKSMLPALIALCSSSWLFILSYVVTGRDVSLQQPSVQWERVLLPASILAVCGTSPIAAGCGMGMPRTAWSRNT